METEKNTEKLLKNFNFLKYIAYFKNVFKFYYTDIIIFKQSNKLFG